jgi:hypothetical protein
MTRLANLAKKQSVALMAEALDLKILAVKKNHIPDKDGHKPDEQHAQARHFRDFNPGLRFLPQQEIREKKAIGLISWEN